VIPVLTPEGRLAAGVVGLAAGVAAVGGSNGLAFAAAAGLAAWAICLAVGWANLRNLSVRRELPAEVFAATDAPGTLVVHNAGRTAACAVEIEDGTAAAVIEGVGPGVERRAPVSWRFARRGPGALVAIQLVSAFPFGWLRWRRTLVVPADLLVLPRPIQGRSRTDRLVEAGEGPTSGRGSGDWVGIRPWRDGDSERHVHWPTSARTGDWMVVERTGSAASAVDVCLDHSLPAEQALSVAAWEVLTASGAVGLRLEDRRFPAQIGRWWKRTLLEALARCAA
jgi:uncharacterized protein (DUF58 family)